MDPGLITGISVFVKSGPKKGGGGGGKERIQIFKQTKKNKARDSQAGKLAILNLAVNFPQPPPFYLSSL